ncbi:chitin synthase 3 [Monosporozyma servazzii]
MENDDYVLNWEDDDFLHTRNSKSSRVPNRQNSLVRPERNRLNDPNDPHFYYAKMAREQNKRLSVQPSTTGVNPRNSYLRGSLRTHHSVSRNNTSRTNREFPLDDLNRNGKTEEVEEFNEVNEDDSNSLLDEQPNFPSLRQKPARIESSNGFSLWTIYYRVITFWAPGFLLALCGMPDKQRQMAWREKVALLTCIGYMGALIAYLTFGFTKTVCGDSGVRIENNDISTGYVSVNGKVYLYDGTSPEGSDFQAEGKNKISGPWNEAGKDASFLYQNVNGNCHNIIMPRDNCSIPYDDDNNLAWYFPCRLIDHDGSSKPNFTEVGPYFGWGCHTTEEERQAFYDLDPSAQIFFSWDDIKNSSRNLVVYNSDVLDLDRLNWLDKNELTYPVMFDDLRNSSLQGYDLSIILSHSHDRKVARCLSEIIKVGEIDSKTVGCIASDIVLYVSLVFILSVVVLKFAVACYFRWFVVKTQGVSTVDNQTLNQQMNNIEDWSENIFSQGPIKPVDPSLRPGRSPYGHSRNDSTMDVLKKQTSKMLNLNESVVDLDMDNDSLTTSSYKGMTTMTLQQVYKKGKKESPGLYGHSRNGSSLFPSSSHNMESSMPQSSMTIKQLDPSNIHPDAVQQPPFNYTPFGYPLIHTLCFVTCYSEDEDGLRTTLDSLATTDYPNSHKLIMVVCDGLIKGSGNDKTTPEIALSMMGDFVTEPEDVLPYSYVAVASGSKRHNMAKIYAGFYKYDNSTIPEEKQQRVPIITIVKCGTSEEQGSSKPGNRGKRDSQIILMSFLQKITFDERMSQLEFQLLKNIWQITGLMGDFYETVLMVDADTKVFPDSLKHMIAEMVRDPSVMGLCGETKIANKRQSWVTAIQVFEYYISHHQSKAFESVFGSVTCLPGCFSLYRIKSPKGSDGYWVPILSNPDIVERYSDNVTNTLHKKNLLLLGEDRYLSYLMLKTFPRRKQIFVPKAACKTVVPDTFKVLLSQRRRWINSTVHNLFELVLIRDLCGTFCFSMQFVIMIELIGTLVLPLAICFTIYVIIFAIISHPTPVLTLVLLALILGLPGLLVVVTATRWSYLIWMGIYILALPIWNFVLPSYAYWKFDDFSWGDTRTIAGGNKNAGSHDDAEGEFDYTKITMKTWREYEAQERLKKSDDFEMISSMR